MNLQDVEDSVIGFLSKLPNRDAALLRSTLRALLGSAPDVAKELDDIAFEAVAKRIEAKLVIGMQDAAAVQTPFAEWLAMRRANTPTRYYDRYRKHLQANGFPPAVLGVLDKDTDRITGLLENPEKPGPWTRRGLVVGNVQSGKTANYTGVICKAADYGYRFIVLLTGMQDNLRIQTQERIEEGFIGLNSEGIVGKKNGDRESALIGVGFFDRERIPIAVTTRDSDFKAVRASQVIPLKSVSEPIILVMKKNGTIMQNLIDWLTANNPAGSGKIANIPMLLIDDEADNASINTKKNENSPTEINKKIRELLSMFDMNTYVGYTATPFANIFIDPESVDAMQREDLFPKDFIVSLDAPTNYVGASRIFLEDGDLHYMIRRVDDHAATLPLVHKTDLKVETLPPSLHEAIRCFVLARAVRIARGHGTEHSSMLINVSRLNEVQTQVTGLVNDYLNTVRAACVNHAALPQTDALKDPVMKSLYDTWISIYPDVPEKWTVIQRLLPEAVGPIDVRKINSKSPDALIYRKHKDTGLHVIAVGGLSLSRGFTLEGLTISYFLRNSIMYDTLLQMGRWFGYRDGYEDVCRIYMTASAASWYSHICEAIEELRDELRRMEREKRTPIEFGLCVRAHPDSLIVTARNKMRTGRLVRHSVRLGGKLVETTALKADPSSIESNRDFLNRLVARLNENQKPSFASGLGFIWSKMAAGPIKDFIRAFANHDEASIKTQADPLVRYIDDQHLDTWDVCLYSPVESEGSSIPVDGLSGVHEAIRSAELKATKSGSSYFAVSGESSRVASRGAERAGLTEQELAAAKAKFGIAANDTKNIGDKWYREQRARPLLMLHVLRLKVGSDASDKHKEISHVVAWGISIPPTTKGETSVEYVVNTTWWNENYGEDMEEYEEDINV